MHAEAAYYYKEKMKLGKKSMKCVGVPENLLIAKGS